jgi:DNA-binding NarL/FixJ family response regulator
MNSTITVAVIDDHPIVRDGIVAVIGTQPDMRVVAAADSVAQIDQAVDVIVLDWEIPDVQGARAIAALRERFPQTAVVVFSAYGGTERVRAAMDAGARAYILKGSPADELLNAIRTAVSGGVVLGRGIEPPFTSTNSDTPTARETEVLRLLARGYSNAQIAEHLQISERTVKFHITSLFARLGAKRRTEAVAIARERGYLSP